MRIIGKIAAFVIALVMLESAVAANYNLGEQRIMDSIRTAREKGLRVNNEPFFIGNENSNTGVLLMHGFTASPWEVKELAEYLANASNVSVYCPLIAGHGTSVRDLKETTWEDWYASANESYNLLKNTVDCVYVGGMSTGSSLALMLAMDYDVCGIIAIGTPIFFQSWLARFAGILKYIIPYTKRELSPDIKPYYYEKRPTRAVAELIEMIELMKERLNKVDEPIIIIQSLADKTIKPESADYLMNNISSRDKTFIWFTEGEHVIIKDKQRVEVFKLISEFVQEQETKRSRKQVNSTAS